VFSDSQLELIITNNHDYLTSLISSDATLILDGRFNEVANDSAYLTFIQNNYPDVEMTATGLQQLMAQNPVAQLIPDAQLMTELRVKEVALDSPLREIFTKHFQADPFPAWVEIGIYLGAIGDPRVPVGLIEYGIIAKMRFELDLYVNLRPIKLYHERLCPLKGKTVDDINMLIIRENTEGAYAGMHGFVHKLL